ncbi:nickel pincer cofactor biosynthesis protein LarC [Nocardioides iriomotensis]|uniref:Pyridinium-3,5-bisthiocarboxylic acid mononucleotide nickel insertion protein n=1 Tax=Nocardioides iriomotensis TaxID=715784 RepID=A0A4Q5IW57_9ACTN|nr:nickel pincer cofactor biosynthesis protein LarC [Nocardioides iriomotensis]RYU10340.1 nickel pincer cofactor biosynthesis protein LarC [Nocardioides iriomotensis]
MIGWVDASSGASGDMLLGALVGAGVPVGVIAEAVEKVAPEHVAIVPEAVSRNGFAATRCHVEVADSSTHRTWADIRELLASAGLHEDVRVLAHDTFDRLATAEAAVHGTSPGDVHFHEVGALDAIADVVGVSAGLAHLGLGRLVVSPVAVGSGSVRGAHGVMPVPPPAVTELLRGVPSYGGPVGSPTMELCTPTGAALLVTHATDWGPQPAMTVREVGVGAGGRDPAGHANVLRLLVGEEVVSTGSTTRDGSTDRGAVVLETNVDDLDPRLWPPVLAALLDAGASDAWLTPILMKKGRPAHTLHVLVRPDRVDAVRREVFRHTSTIGVREVAVGKTALERAMRSVTVDGERIAVKLALLDGEVVNAQPEYEDVARVATSTGRPVKAVLAAAVARAQEEAWT